MCPVTSTDRCNGRPQRTASTDNRTRQGNVFSALRAGDYYYFGGYGGAIEVAARDHAQVTAGYHARCRIGSYCDLWHMS